MDIKLFTSLELLIVRIINDEVDLAEMNSNGKEEVGI